jgi:hypothetical protein
VQKESETGLKTQVQAFRSPAIRQNPAIYPSINAERCSRVNIGDGGLREA